MTALIRKTTRSKLMLPILLGLQLILPCSMAMATDGNINDMLGVGAPQTTIPGVNPAPADSHNKPITGKADSELWVQGAKPSDHLQIISAHPLPGDNCRQVIFDGRQTIKRRYDAKNHKALSFDIDRLCLLGLRNDSDDKALVVRLGQSLESIAITPDPDLFSGKVLEPRQQILVPIRPLPVGVLKIPVELVWKTDINKSKPQIDKLAITIKKNSS